MKVKDLLKMDIDVDVVDDVCEELYIAFCGAYKLTDAGKRKFREVLNYECEFHRLCSDDLLCIIHVDDPDEKIWTRKLRKAKELFYSLAGYCAAEDYDKWFEEV